MLSKLYCRSVQQMMIEIRQPVWVGCALAQGRLFCKVGFCVSALCALQMCLTWSVGECRQILGCLNICRMSFRVTYNGLGIGEEGAFKAQMLNFALMPNRIT